MQRVITETAENCKIDEPIFSDGPYHIFKCQSHAGYIILSEEKIQFEFPLLHYKTLTGAKCGVRGHKRFAVRWEKAQDEARKHLTVGDLYIAPTESSQ